MIITEHVVKRCRQRGIPEYFLDMIMDMGAKVKKKPGGVVLMSVEKKKLDMVIHECKAIIQGLERLKRQKVSIVVAEDNDTVITAYRQN